jgi:hypothetical protein
MAVWLGTTEATRRGGGDEGDEGDEEDEEDERDGGDGGDEEGFSLLIF